MTAYCGRIEMLFAYDCQLHYERNGPQEKSHELNEMRHTGGSIFCVLTSFTLEERFSGNLVFS